MSDVTITFTGCGDTLGSGGRLHTCFHVDAPSSTFLIDCGASALPALKRAEVEPNDVETILLTHLHGDHFGGLPFFVLDAQLRSDRTAPLTVAGPPGVRERVVEAMEVFFPGLSGVDQAFDLSFVEFTDDEVTEIGLLEVTPREVVHPSGAPPFALRVTVDEQVIAYSGDTEWTDALVDVARGADLFLCEVYFYEKQVPYHLSYSQLDAERDRLDADRIIATHMSDDMLARRDVVELETATDGAEVTL